MSNKSKIFTFDDAWSGNYYELCIYIEPSNIEALEKALKRLWSHQTLSGCYLERNKEPVNQQVFSVDQLALAEQSIYGVGTLPNGEKVACATHTVIFDECVFFNFSIPFGSLGTKYDIGSYPFRDKLALDWQKTIDNWFCELSNYIL
jgi:hypothetical protein